MTECKSRRNFLKQSVLGTVAAGMVGTPLSSGRSAPLQTAAQTPRFKISLAAWSLHRAIFGGLVKSVNLPRIVRQSFGIGAIELVNTLLEVPTQRYLQQMKKNAAAEDVKYLLIMCDAEGAMADKDNAARRKAVQNHHKWVDIAAELGCHSIRVNLRGEEPGTAEDRQALKGFIARAVEAFSLLCDYGAKSNINVIVENHGGLSSNADVLVRVMKEVGLPNFGTLPDFGNFGEGVDRYEGVRRLMSYAKGVSAKSHAFDAQGNETGTDYGRMMKIVLDDASFSGYIGIEYEGDRLSEYEGIIATKRLLEKYQT